MRRGFLRENFGIVVGMFVLTCLAGHLGGGGSASRPDPFFPPVSVSKICLENLAICFRNTSCRLELSLRA